MEKADYHGTNKKLKSETKNKMISVIGLVQSRVATALASCPDKKKKKNSLI